VLSALALTGCTNSSSGTAAPATHARTAAPSSPAGASGPAPSASGSAVPAGAHLSPQDFASAASLAGTVILDVRTAAEFAAGHLPGAVNADVESADFTAALAGLDKNAPYAVYCHSGRRSGIALHQMKTLGFAHAYDLAGGIAAWTAAGGQVVTAP